MFFKHPSNHSVRWQVLLHMLCVYTASSGKSSCNVLVYPLIDFQGIKTTFCNLFPKVNLGLYLYQIRKKTGRQLSCHESLIAKRRNKETEIKNNDIKILKEVKCYMSKLP